MSITCVIRLYQQGAQFSNGSGCGGSIEALTSPGQEHFISFFIVFLYHSSRCHGLFFYRGINVLPPKHIHSPLSPHTTAVYEIKIFNCTRLRTMYTIAHDVHDCAVFEINGAHGARRAHFRSRAHVFRTCAPDGRTCFHSIIIVIY